MKFSSPKYPSAVYRYLLLTVLRKCVNKEVCKTFCGVTVAHRGGIGRVLLINSREEAALTPAVLISTRDLIFIIFFRIFFMYAVVEGWCIFGED